MIDLNSLVFVRLLTQYFLCLTPLPGVSIGFMRAKHKNLLSVSLSFSFPSPYASFHHLSPSSCSCTFSQQAFLQEIGSDLVCCLFCAVFMQSCQSQETVGRSNAWRKVKARKITNGFQWFHNAAPSCRCVNHILGFKACNGLYSL